MTTHGPYTFDTENDTDCQAFTFTSDGNGQASAGVITAAGTAADFCHDTNGGNSTNIGPSEAQDAPGGYLYTECSSPGADGDIYTMTFDTVLDAAAEQWQFNFYTIQRAASIGDNQSECVVQINENSGGWVTVSAQLGGTGNDTTDGTAWVSQSIDLSESGANVDSSTQVRIQITTKAGTAWHGDYGIDTVEIVGTPAPTREQDKFRFYDDDGTESSSTALAAQDTDVSRGTEDPFHVRVGMQATGDLATEAGTAQYKETSDAAAEWRDID